MVGEATSGSADNGTCKYAIAPTINIATINSVVATGRRMKMRDGFTASLRLRWFAATFSTSRIGSAGGIRFGRRRGAGRRTVRRGGASLNSGGRRQLNLRAIAQPIAALGHDDLARL